MTSLSPDTGIIVLQPWEFENGATLSYAASDAKLTFFLTYFSRVMAAPIATQMLFTSTEMEQTLVHQDQIKLAIPSRYEVDELNAKYFERMAHNIYESANDVEHSGWAVSPPEASRSGLEVAGGANSIVVTLEKSLPCPHPHTPVQEILQFRTEFAPQLRRFRKTIDDMYVSINGSEADVIRNFRARLRDDVEAAQSAATAAGLRSFRASLSVALRILAPAMGLLLAPGHELLAATLGEGISFAVEKSGLAPPSNRLPPDFEYVLHGVSRGLTQAFPSDFDGSPDIHNIVFQRNSINSFYPRVIRPPMKASYSVWQDNYQG